jgi:phosphatidylglycerophosphate synthase
MDAGRLPFLTPFGSVFLPWWVVALVIGREIFMTVFRQAAARRGVVISAIGSAKWKTGFQSVWVGSAYFWFFAATLAARNDWNSAAWRAFAYFNGIVGTITMVTSVVLTVYSLALYLRRYAGVFVR